MSTPNHTIHGLSDAHYTELALGSAISEQRIRERYYQSVTADQLPPEFADYQRRPGLLIPIRSVRGQIESFQLKPDEPRMGKNGKPIKYETAANAPQIIDCPPSAERLLGEPNCPLFITEGAKKVDAAVAAGMISTIGLQGVFGWRGRNENGGSTVLADWEHIALNNRTVVIAFDSDVMTKESVRGALDRLAGFLRSKKARVKFLILPELPDGSKCGLDDFFAGGGKQADLNKYLATELPPLATLVSPETRRQVAAFTPVTRCLRDIEEKEIDWLWPGWLPAGMFTLLGGYAGDGKSTLTMALASIFSRGGTLPDGSSARQLNTLLMVGEDEMSHVVKPRLSVHNADMDRIFDFPAARNSDGEEQHVNLRMHTEALRKAILDHNIGLVIIDPLSSFLANGDRNSEGDVRDTLQPLVKVMEETGCAVIGIMHIGKNDGQAKAFQKLMGSTAFTALARSVWMVSNLPEDYQAEGEPTRKMLGVAKSNYAVTPPPLQFHRPQDAALEWLGNSPISLDQAFAWKPKAEKEETDSDRAEAWLIEYMAGKRVLASEVEAAAKAEGFGISNLKKAKARMGLKSIREGGVWYWVQVPGNQAA